MAFCKGPEKLKINCDCSLENSENYTASGLVHYFVVIEDDSIELEALKYYLDAFEFKQAIVFVRNAERAVVLADIMLANGYPETIAVHAGQKRSIRRELMELFNEDPAEMKLMITSTCSHGMEFKNVDVIVHFDAATSPSQYYHRVCSKTVRKGLVLTFTRNLKFKKVLQDTEEKYKISISHLPSKFSTETYMDCPFEVSEDEST